jgi:hypothetical protein
VGWQRALPVVSALEGLLMKNNQIIVKQSHDIRGHFFEQCFFCAGCIFSTMFFAEIRLCFAMYL